MYIYIFNIYTCIWLFVSTHIFLHLDFNFYLYISARKQSFVITDFTYLLYF